MTDLASLGEIRRQDPSNLLDRIARFPSQLREALRLSASIQLKRYKSSKISSVVISGVGGSAIGAEFVRSRLVYASRVPVSVIRHYRLPQFVDGNTLVIASSYSGDTEETLSAVEEALQKKARVIALASGGHLQEIARAKGLDFFHIPAGYPPRAAIGFSIVFILSILEALGIAPSVKKEVEESFLVLERLAKEEYGVHVPESGNQAKRLARLLFGKFPVIYAASDTLEAVALRWRGELEENAKTLAGHFLFPEMTHNEIVGWHEPQNLLEQFLVIFLTDPSDHPQIKRQFDYSEKVIQNTGAQVVRLEALGSSPLARMFSLAYLGDFVSFYLAMLNGVDPTAIEVIDRLKKELTAHP